jgi:hypothetical protein
MSLEEVATTANVFGGDLFLAGYGSPGQLPVAEWC